MDNIRSNTFHQKNWSIYKKLPINDQIAIFNEKDLHYNVIKFIRNIFYEPIIITPLGENQITSEMRIDSYNKGYTKGAPDILLLNYHKH